MGWQRQMHGPSVQAAIETAIHAITGETVEVLAAGRTDAGVHASAMVAHADIAKSITPFRLMEAINARLVPQPVAILDIAIAPGFHARFDCTGRR
jgi:tRNA pseudouridine38-40 synthase